MQFMEINAKIARTSFGVWVIRDDTHFTPWIEQAGRLDHDQWMLGMLLEVIQPGDTVIDIGAYIGDHTTAYLNKTGTSGKVYAFEPNPVAYECLKRNCPQANSYNCAVGNSTQKNVDFNENPGNFGASFVRAEDQATNGTEVVSLDAFVKQEKLARLNFVKIDVEGFEPFVIQGGASTLGTLKPVLCVEVVDGHLRRNGYTRNDLMQLICDLGYTYIRMNKNISFLDDQYDILCFPSTAVPKNSDCRTFSEVIDCWRLATKR